MKIISHRGNLDGPDPATENSPYQIDMAISKGYLVEIDLRIHEGGYWLGHDVAQYQIDKFWLHARKDDLIIHAKTLETCDDLAQGYFNLNWFYHTDEDVVQTSRGWLWAYPGIYLNNAITVILNKEEIFPENILGVCTDYPNLIKIK